MSSPPDTAAPPKKKRKSRRDPEKELLSKIGLTLDTYNSHPAVPALPPFKAEDDAPPAASDLSKNAAKVSGRADALVAAWSRWTQLPVPQTKGVALDTAKLSGR